MAQTITAAELRVVVSTTAAQAATELRSLHADVQNLGRSALPPQMKDSIAQVGSVSAATSRSVLDLAAAQQQLRVDTATNHFSALNEKLSIARQRFDEVSKTTEEGSVKYRNAALAVSTLENKVNAASSSLALQRDKLDAIKAGSGDAANAVQLLGNSYSNSAVAIAALSGRLTEQRAAVKETKAALDQLKSGADSATTGTSNLTVSVTALAATEGRIGSWGQIWIGAMRRIGSEIVNLLPSIGSIIGESANIEQTMNVLQQSTGATAEQMALLSAKATALGADMTLPGASASGAASAMLELSRAGLDVNSTLDASIGVLRLATAAQVDNATAAQITAGALNAFSLSGSEANTVASQFAAGANESSASITDLADGFKQAGFQFAAVGYSANDLITSLAALTNVGLTGSDAGTALKNALTMLAAPGQGAANLMKDLGINVRDANGYMLPLPDLLSHLRDKLGELGPAQRDAAMHQLVLSDGAKALGPLLKMNADEFAALSQKIDAHGAATATAEAQSRGLSGAMDGFRSTMATLADNGLRPLLPLMTSTVRNLSEFAGVLADHAGPAAAAFVRGVKAVYDGAKVAFEWIRDNANTILTTLAIGAGAVVVAFAPMVLGIAASMTASAAASMTIGGLATSIKGLGMSAVAAAGPYIALAAAIGLATYAAKMYTDYHERIADGTKAMLDGLAWYASATSAVASYNDIQGAASETTKQAATELQTLQQQLHELTMAHTAHKDLLDADDEAKFVEKEFELKAAIEEKTRAVVSGVAADRAAAQQIGSNLEGLRGIREGYTDAATGADMYGKGLLSVSMTAGLTVDELNKINQAIKDITSSGTQSMAQIVTSNASFQTDTETRRAKHLDTIKSLEDAHNAAVGEDAKAAIQDKINAENTAYADQQTNAATQYAALQAQQRASLGVMLQDWIAAQSLISPAFAEKSADLYQLVQQRYGTIASAEQMAFGSSAQILTDYANGVITNMADANAALDGSERKYSDLVIAQNALRSELITSIVTRFESGGYGNPNSDEAMRLYEADLQNVERTVLTTVQLDAAQAQASAAQAQDAINRIPNHYQSKAFLDANMVDPIARSATDAINSIPDAHTTILNVDATSGKAAAYSAGVDFVSGMAAGINASAYMVANASQKTAATAAAAARNYLQIQSPSKLMFIIGGYIPEGMAMGIEARGSTISEALVSVIGKGASKATIAAAEGIGKIADTVGGAITALEKLNGFTAPSTGAITAMSESLKTMVEAFAANVVAMKPKAAEAVKAYADTAGSIVSVVSEGATALASLDEFVAPPALAMNAFVASLGLLVQEFSTEAADLNADLFDGATAFAETAGAALDVIGKGLGGFQDMAEFTPIPEIAMSLVSLALRDLVRAMSARVAELDLELLPATDAFSASAGAAVGVIGDALEAFTALESYTGTPVAALEMIAAAISSTIVLMVDMAGRFDSESITATAAFSESVSKIISPISTAVSSFNDLKAYEGLAPSALSTIGADMENATALMVGMAQRADSEQVGAAAAFSTSISTVFDALSGGINALSDLASYQGLGPDALNLISNDMASAVGVIQALAGMAQSAETEGQTWANALESFADNVRRGLSAIESVNGLSVNVSASVSASASAGGEGAPAVDGSHATGLDFVGKNGYIAELHYGERVLSNDNARKLDSVFGILAEMTSGSTRPISGADMGGGSTSGSSRKQEDVQTVKHEWHIYNNMDREIFMEEIAQRMNRGVMPFH